MKFEKNEKSSVLVVIILVLFGDYFVSDIAIFVPKRDVKLQLTNFGDYGCYFGSCYTTSMFCQNHITSHITKSSSALPF